MKIKWLGHAMFEIFDDDSQTKVITDPYSEDVGYPVAKRTADVVTISHHHFDHDNLQSVEAELYLDAEVNQEFRGLQISSFRTYHDEAHGSKRGTNLIFKFSGSAKVAHLGDYGEPKPRKEVIDFLADAEAILLPVGGVYTIGPEEAAELVRMLKPSIVVPMHFKTQHLRFELEGVERFLEAAGLPFEKKSELIVEREASKGETRIVVLDYEV